MEASPGRSRLVRIGDRVSEARSRGLDPAERRRIMDAVAFRVEGGWPGQFALMLGLSVLVAVMGLSAGSAAVVIGAMLLAPLMTPVMGIAAALAMFVPRYVFRSLLVVGVASVAAVGASYLVAVILPEGPLSAEILARTRPDLRDLIVTLAAGAAGAYATVRRDVSASLPGVAVAVALVPPATAPAGSSAEVKRADRWPGVRGDRTPRPPARTRLSSEQISSADRTRRA
jgi:uncharacterized hydrophobic protein (TIGR00271 family)